MKNAENLEHALGSDPSGVSELNRMGQSPLQFAANWDEGTEMLIEAGANTNTRDHARLLPLLYACEYGCVESVQFLIEGDSTVAGILERAIQSDPPIGDLVIRALVDRRRRLEKLAKERLASTEFQSFAAYGEKILDDGASEVLFYASG